MTFEELLAASAGDQLIIPESWAQGRATFGGLTGALAFDRMKEVVTPGRPMRAMQVSFVGPVEPDLPVTMEAELLREGKAVSQTMVRMVQDGSTRLVALGSYGGGRESAVTVPPVAAPEAPAPEDCRPTPYIEGLMPSFTQFIEMRWCFGGLPFSGKDHREMGGWMQFREPPAELGDAGVIGLIDAWPAAILQHLTERVPASSLSWSVELVHPRPEVKPDEWLLYRATTDQAGEGYGHIHAEIWNRKGELVAISRQTVVVFG
ncbi:Acyl-CoA thioesterase [Marinobacter daqiaonensis]|uniref:Acyl-CoA thioesterase n=1 Tax=Marinobacter daqiaonensis TaxID=650891 RepID=A0A1I6J424_9GAMM|nr:thioesterase family protein [Marinobacter daqiaonensis]SFR73677.1 Acyl-CoA thioesterase [Marinobacter daqiaonensis]